MGPSNPPADRAILSTKIVTLGRVAVYRDGVELEGLLSQPLRLALLIYLAVEGEATRGTLESMFWPRRKQDRARHSLNQALYQLRSVLGRDALATRGEFVRAVSMDVDCVGFEEGTVPGRWSGSGGAGEGGGGGGGGGGKGGRGLGAYAGPFLDGFPDPTPAFAQWAAERRRRYVELNRGARRARLDRLAAASDRPAAIEMARQWVRTDPQSQEAGDRLAALLNASRAERPAPSAGTAPRRVPAPAGRRARPLLPALFILALVAAGISFLGGPPAPAAGSGSGAVVVGVLPFLGEAATADPLSPQRRITEAMAWLPGVEGAESPGDAPLMPGWSAARAAATLAAARQHGFRYLVTGELGGAGDGPPLTIELWDVHSGARLLRETAFDSEAPEDALARVALSVLLVIADRERTTLGLPEAVLADTRSPAALGHFLHGRHLMSAGDMGAARAAFSAAIRNDSTFGHAWVRAALAEAWVGKGEAAYATATRGHRFGDALDDGPRRLLAALQRHAGGDAAGAIADFHAAVDDDPTSPDARAGLALALESQAGLGGAELAEVAHAYRALLHRDSLYAPIHDRLFDLAILQGDSAGAAAALDRRPRGGPNTIKPLIFAIVHGEHRARAAALDSLRWHDMEIIEQAFRIVARAPGGLLAADSLGAILQQPIRTPSDQARGGGLRLIALAGAGHWQAAVRAWRHTAIHGLDPVIVAAHLMGWPARELAEPVYRTAAAWDGWDTGPAALTARRILVHRATIDGDSAHVRAALRTLAGSTTAGDAAERRALRGALNARLLLLRGDTAAATTVLDSALSALSAPRLDRDSPRPLDCLGPQRLLAANLHFLRGDTAAARRWTDALRHSPCPADRMALPLAPVPPGP